MSCSFGPAPRAKTKSRSKSVATDTIEASKRKPSEWTYHLMDVHRHVGKAADMRLRSSSSCDESMSNCVSWHMRQGHKKLMGQEAQKLVQDAALLENCIDLEPVQNCDNPDIDDLTLKAQLLLTHFGHDQRMLIDSLVSPPPSVLSVAG